MSDDEKLVGEFPFLPKQERAQVKRNALIESGYALFQAKGYEQTTAKDIAAHAGVATGTFYRYFSDKRQLLMSLLEDKIETFLPPEISWISNDPVSSLATSLENHYNRIHEFGLRHVLPELLSKDSELANVLEKARKRIHERIQSSLKQAREKGLVWSDLDLDTVSWAIMIIVENGLDKINKTENKCAYQDIAKLICRMVFPPTVLNQLRGSDVEAFE
ncbi:TetR/AcrR family transcriptional regulator [Neobacillus cucumis]|uniref:TetR/AcrR family transcriptional regulator n=1 Tax=Neobacillus cucumis TaxID=1740721 RepID=A0A2N5HNU1_9BACI|nr:TetR/AcrR family transcriptional regulator [Neobacillus cucumis]PLS07180.1 TetR/AcrR family transcriptional regulator [Neobacillus cucumis]